MNFKSVRIAFTTLLLTLYSFNIPLTVNAANLVSIVVADTLDPSIGDSVKADFENIGKNLELIAKFTQLNLVEIKLEKEEATPLNLLEKLDALVVDQEDVLLFYFAGHGYHPESKVETTPWPSMLFSHVGVGVKYATVLSELENKNPRLLLTIMDSCNEIVPEDQAPFRVRSAHFGASDDVLERNYKKLFLETSGSIKIVSSTLGQFAWGESGVDPYPGGGVFTSSFIDNLNAAVQTIDECNWQDILEKTSDQTIMITTNLKASIQKPYYEVKIN